jgi:hypothetical protein
MQKLKQVISVSILLAALLVFLADSVQVALAYFYHIAASVAVLALLKREGVA